MADPAGWYPDPTSRHELRYWDGYAWSDNVSDKGASANDPLGGTPMPPPSEAASKAAAPAVAPSKTPVIVAVAVAAVVVVVAAAFILTRDNGGNDKAKGGTVLSDKPFSVEDQGTDAAHPTVHSVQIPDNTVVLIDVESREDNLAAGVIVETTQDVVDKVSSKIDGVGDFLKGSLHDACSNLREEDLGAKGNVAYDFFGIDGGGPSTLQAFTFMPVGGEYEFIPVLVDENGQCRAGHLELTLDPHFLDFSSVQNLDDLDSVLSNDPNSDLQSRLSGS